MRLTDYVHLFTVSNYDHESAIPTPGDGTVTLDLASVALEQGAPGEHDGIRGIEDPYEHEGALRPKPAHEAEAENPHQDADQLDGLEVVQDE